VAKPSSSKVRRVLINFICEADPEASRKSLRDMSTESLLAEFGAVSSAAIHNIECLTRENIDLDKS